MAKKYPERRRSSTAAGCATEGKHPENVGSYFGYIDECQYLSGIVAGHATKSKKLGFVAAKPIPQVLRNINAFTLGARSVDPTITVHGHLHRRLVDAGQGSRSHQQPDRPGRRRHHLPRGQPQGGRRDGRTARHSWPAATTPARRPSLRRAISPAPNGTGTRSTPITSRRSRRARRSPHLVRGGLKEGIVKTVALRPGRERRRPRRQADAVKAKLMDGHFRHLQGADQGQQGQRSHPRRQGLGQTAIELESMNYLVEGVVGE